MYSKPLKNIKLPPKAGMQKLGLVSLEKTAWRHSNLAVSKGAYRKAGRGILPLVVTEQEVRSTN